FSRDWSSDVCSSDLVPLSPAGSGVALHYEEWVVPMSDRKYAGQRPPAMDPAGLAAEVRRRLSPGRFAHVEGVVQAAAELARRWGVAEDKAVLAAWLQIGRAHV